MNSLLRTAVVALVLPVSAGTLHGDVITVDDDGPADFSIIQDAVDFAESGDEILVSPGTYFGSGTNDIIDPLGKAILIRGVSGAAPVVLSGALGARGIICRSGEDADTVIEGFTIQDCSAPWYDWNGNGGVDFWEYFGGGLWCRDGSSPTIRNCMFMLNSAEYGGAIYNGDESGTASDPAILDCTFLLNKSAPATGGVGGAIYNSGSSPRISDSLFDGNAAYSGGAILNWTGSNPIIENCIFDGNSARNGGALYNYGCSPKIVDCSFSENIASLDGGAVHNADPESSVNVPVFLRCTFAANQAASDGGGIENFSVSPEITDCVFTGNDAGDGSAIHSWNSSDPRVRNTLVCSNPGMQISGSWTDLGGNTVSAACVDDCLGDINADGLVDGADLNILLGDWGQSGSVADLDASGLVDGEDLLVILGAWGPCP